MIRLVWAVIFAQSLVTAQAELRPEEVFHVVAPRTFVVLAEGSDGAHISVGSAVVIGPSTLVTNAHVIRDARVAVLKQGERIIRASIVRIHRERDLALLRVYEDLGTGPRLRSFRTLKVGERVYALGTPRLLESTFSDGLIAALRPAERYPIQTSAPVSEGSSGGGLFDASGALVGIVVAINKSGQNLNFALPADWVAELAASPNSAATPAEGAPQHQETSLEAMAAAPTPNRPAPKTSWEDEGPNTQGEGRDRAPDLARDEGTPGIPTPTPGRKQSLSGWETLRWGMPPKEVSRLLTAKEGPFRATRACELEVRKYSKDWRARFPNLVDYRASCDIAPEDHSYRINGAAPEITLHFDSDGLQSVGLQVIAMENTLETAFAALMPVYTQLRDDTDRRFGTPTATTPTDIRSHFERFASSGLRVWERDETKARLNISGGTAVRLYITADLEYCGDCPRRRTSPKTWAQGGWQKFRWGMGPGDVEAVVGGGFRLRIDRGYAGDSMHGEGKVYVGNLPTQLYGATVEAKFIFGGDRLYWVLLAPLVEKDASRCSDWERSIRVGLEQKYGRLLRNDAVLDQPTMVMLHRSLKAPERDEGPPVTYRCNQRLSYKERAVSRWQDEQLERRMKKTADESL